MKKIPELSLFFFSADSTERRHRKYQLLLDAAKLGDECGFTAVWTPERHFQKFGGLYGNPSLTSAALAVMTERISIRAGSVVLPLQDPLRIAEEWSMVDNLSDGRVAIGAASGWHVNDFVLSPNVYRVRRQDMLEKLATVRKLWRGEKIALPNGSGILTEVGILPPPIQPELPIWLTGESDETFLDAGVQGYNVLTANFALKHDLNEFRRKAKIYRDAVLANHGHRGHITLMAHCFVAEHGEGIEDIAWPAMARYLGLNIQMQDDNRIGTGNHVGFVALSEQDREKLIRYQVGNDFHGPLSFVGTLDHCARQAEQLLINGVDEIACLIDFGIAHHEVMSSLCRLSTLI